MDTHADFISQRTRVIQKSRSLTRKEKIIILSDELGNEVPGLPRERGFIYVPFGQFNKLTVEMSQTFGELAAVYVAPAVIQKMIYPADVRRIRQLTNAENALFIWDDLEATQESLNESLRLRKTTVIDYHLSKPELQGHNKHETDFVLGEIFERKTYLKHGLTIKDHDVVIDIGANIGLFSLFAKACAPECRVYAYEPSREIFSLLQANTKNFGTSVQCFNLGVSDEKGSREFTFYPGYSVISGLHTDRKKDEAVILAGEKFKPIRETDEVIRSRFEERRSYAVETLSLSDLIEENQISRIDYLKIDAEKSELEILTGLKVRDWPKISQIALEVHGEAPKEEILKLLHTHEFETWTDTAIATTEETIYTVYGRRR